MKFLYFLAAIGGPDLEKKFKILARNLIYIHHTLKQDFSIAINCYNSFDEVSEFVKRFSFLDKVYFHSRPNSVLTELWFTNPYMRECDDYDEILFILDDVSISSSSPKFNESTFKVLGQLLVVSSTSSPLSFSPLLE